MDAADVGAARSRQARAQPGGGPGLHSSAATTTSGQMRPGRSKPLVEASGSLIELIGETGSGKSPSVV